MDIVTGFLALLLTLVAGGAISRLLDEFTAWREWKPQDPIVKTIAVAVLTGLVGVGLLFLQQYLVPSYFEGLPEWAKALLVSFALFYGSQRTFTTDSFSKLKLTVAALTLPQAVIDECPAYPRYECLRAEFIPDGDPRNDGTTNVYLSVLDENGSPDSAQFVHQAWPQVPDHNIVLHPDGYKYTAVLDGGSNFDPNKEIGPQRFYVNDPSQSDVVRGIGLVGSHHDQWYLVFRKVLGSGGGGATGDALTAAQLAGSLRAQADALEGK